MADLAVDDVAEQSPGSPSNFINCICSKGFRYKPASFTPAWHFILIKWSQVARACKHRLIPPDETALLLVANYD
jgi:hypothetical protein